MAVELEAQIEALARRAVEGIERAAGDRAHLVDGAGMVAQEQAGQAGAHAIEIGQRRRRVMLRPCGARDLDDLRIAAGGQRQRDRDRLRNRASDPLMAAGAAAFRAGDGVLGRLRLLQARFDRVVGESD